MDAKHIADLLTHLANATRRGELHHDAATAHEAALWELAHRKGLREDVATLLGQDAA